MSKQDQNLLIRLLGEELELLDKSIETLKLSVSKCEQIEIRDEITFEEMESFDSLTSKFGRTSDLYTQKILRTIWMLLHEPFVPFIDLLNKAEKIDLIHSADEMIDIRDLRNQIAHEYIPEAITQLVPEVLDNCKILIKNISETIQFVKNRNWL